MLKIFGFIREFTHLAIFLRLSFAVLCGGTVGIEREIKHRAAGFRTHILICMGAAVTTVTSQYLSFSLGLYTDLARLGAQVISGIGFVGAGAIIVTRQNRVKGLTTAAGLWDSAIIGLACGAGFVECAVAATVIIVLAEVILIKLEAGINRRFSEMRVYVEYSSPDGIDDILSAIKSNHGAVTDIEISAIEGRGAAHCADISVRTSLVSHHIPPDEYLRDCRGVLRCERL